MSSEHLKQLPDRLQPSRLRHIKKREQERKGIFDRDPSLAQGTNISYRPLARESDPNLVKPAHNFSSDMYDNLLEPNGKNDGELNNGEVDASFKELVAEIMKRPPTDTS